jgi:photosystem II stability/assembly factor-like uncharacterized protein
MKKSCKFLIICIICLSLFSIEAQAQWVQINTPEDDHVVCFAIKDTVVFAGTSVSGIYSSTDNGDSWSEMNTGLTNKSVHAITIDGSNLYAGTSGGVFLSTDNGASWEATNTGLTELYIWAFAVGDTNLFTGTMSGVFRLKNDGTRWTDVTSELTSTIIRALAIRDTYIFAGAYDRGVFRSTDNGDTWIEAREGMYSGYVRTLAIKDTILFAGSWGGVFVSTDNASNWTDANDGLTQYDIRAFAISDTILFAGSYAGGVFYSTNHGTNWIEVNSGLTNKYVESLAVNETHIFASTLDNILWRRLLSETTTSLHGLPECNLPIGFSLEQNYPNPFNPSTTLKFTLPKQESIKITIHNTLGEELETLLNKKMPAGSHEIEFNAQNISSGIYFYHIQAGEFQDVKKMILLK